MRPVLLPCCPDTRDFSLNASSFVLYTAPDPSESRRRSLFMVSRYTLTTCALLLSVDYIQAVSTLDLDPRLKHGDHGRP